MCSVKPYIFPFLSNILHIIIMFRLFHVNLDRNWQKSKLFHIIPPDLQAVLTNTKTRLKFIKVTALTLQSVSYTHLDVYKRQVSILYVPCLYCFCQSDTSLIQAVNSVSDVSRLFVCIRIKLVTETVYLGSDLSFV